MAGPEYGDAGDGVSRLYSDRICTPEETLAKVEPLLRRFGITRLARLTSLDCIGIPVWNAVVPNARSIVINQGKGLTDIDAKVSAAMEALERAVAGDPALERIRTSGIQLSRAGCRWDALSALVGAGQEDLRPDELTSWVWGRDLASGEPVFVPYDAVVLDRTVRSRFWQSSDGLASGNTSDEAELHALLERIERDAYVLWQMDADSALRAIDPACFDDAIINDLVSRITSAGLSIRLFDMTSDIAVPAYAAFIAPAAITRARYTRYVDVAHGCGCHPDPVRAVLRAMTEAAQSRLTFISGARDDIPPEAFDRPLSPAVRRLFELPVGSMQPPSHGFLRGAGRLREHVLGRLQSSGAGAVIAVDLGDPGLPFHVSKVFVPGLENPEGNRKRRLGARALSRSLETI